MWNYRIEPAFEFRAILNGNENHLSGVVFDRLDDAKKILAELPNGFEIVPFMVLDISN